MKTAKELIQILRTTDECSMIEAKECGKKIDRSVMETICAFANEPDLGGGYIVLGLHDEKTITPQNRYTVVGIENPDKIQNDIATQCATIFNRRIVVHTNTEIIDGKTVLVIHVPEGQQEAKPFYFAKIGFPKGAYRRILNTDQECNDDDIPILCEKNDEYDKAIVEDSTLDDVDENALRNYRERRAKVNSNAEELDYNDIDLLQSLGCIKKNKEGEWRLTNTGLLVFGKSAALRRIYPMVRADYIRIPGDEWVEDPDIRFETIDMRGPMILLVNRIFNAIIDDLPRQFVLNEGETQASSAIRLPSKALREAIVNALIHRSYRTNRPIQIIRYSNRIEIINPGYSLKPEDTLGEPGSALRNPMISAIFHETDLAETKGSGMKSMRLLMSKANLLPPTYESSHSKNTFTLRILFHHLLDKDDMMWLKSFEKYDFSATQATAMVFLKEVGAIDVLSFKQLTGLSKSEARKDIGKLASLGLLSPKGRGSKAYYVASAQANELISTGKMSKDTTSEAKDTTSEAKDTTSEAKDTTFEAKDTTSEAKDTTSCEDITLVLSDEIKHKLKILKKKESLINLRNLVEQMCSTLPMSTEQIASAINRDFKYTRRKIINPLKSEGKLSFTHPEMANHPNQKYKIGFNSRYYSEKSKLRTQ